MTLGYARGYMDRATADGDGPITFVAATEGRKGDGIDLRMSGARLERFRANPVVNYGHRYFSRQDLPIGRGQDSRVDGGRLLIDVSFDRGDEFAAEVERKYRGGFMNAVSIGFEVLQWEGGKGNYWSGGVAEVWELTELSAVPVPMDAMAVAEGGRGVGDVEEIVRRELARLLRALPRLGPNGEDTEDEWQVPANPTRIPQDALADEDRELPEDVDTDTGVDPDAARDLLASIDLLKGSH